MTARKQKRRTAKAGSQTSVGVASLAAQLTERSMTYWLEKISPLDIALSWKRLKENVKVAPRLITSVGLESGTTFKGDLQGVAIAFTTRDGFAIHFMLSDTSKSDGGTDANS